MSSIALSLSLRSRLLLGGAIDAYALNSLNPDLVLDFYNEYYRTNGVKKTFSNAVNHSRASSATMVDSTGTLITVGANVPRVGHHVWNGSAWVNEGLLHESEARTNLVTYSEASVANWVNSSATLTQLSENYFGAFLGVRVASTGADWHRIDTPAFSWTAGVSYAVTWWYVSGSSGRVRLLLRDNATASESRIIGVTGSVVVTSQAAGTLAHQETVHFGGGVYLTSAVFTPSSSTTVGRIGVGPDSNTAGQDIIALGTQLEAGSTPSSYIPTAGTTVTRAADILTVPAANLPYSATAMSIQMNGRMTYAAGIFGEVQPSRWLLDANNYIRHYIRGDGAFVGDAYFTQAASGCQDAVSATTPDYPTGVLVPFNIASRHGSTFINGAVDGVALTANLTPVALPDLSATDLQLGYDYMGTIRTFRFWNKDLGDMGIVEATIANNAFVVLGEYFLTSDEEYFIVKRT